MDRENYCARSLRRRAFEIVLMAVAMFLSPLVCWVGVFCYTGCRVLICKWKEPRRTTFLFTFFVFFLFPFHGGILRISENSSFSKFDGIFSKRESYLRFIGRNVAARAICIMHPCAICIACFELYTEEGRGGCT